MCVQIPDRGVKGKVAIDFRRIILDYNFSGYVSNRSEINTISLVRLEFSNHVDRQLKYTVNNWGSIFCRNSSQLLRFIWRLSSATENWNCATRIFVVFHTSRALGKAGTLYLWQDDYIAALAETDPEKQRQRIYQAIVAIEQRRLSPLEPGSEEHTAIERAEKALAILKRRLSES